MPRCLRTAFMPFPLFQRTRVTDKIGSLYGAIVAQARQPAFYAAYGVPDTMDGRCDMIVLHVALFFRRVRKEAEPVRALGQGVFDRFCDDMEHNFREIGLSDVAIPKEMRRVGEAYYGRAAAYDRALARDDQTGLADALARNVFADATRVDAARLAAYVRTAVDALARQDSEMIATGAVSFPEPAAIPAVAPAPV
jgi:cytochrome b pre-mRNA-processing protein 3